MAFPEKMNKLCIVCPPADCDRILGLLSAKAPFGWEEKSLPDGRTEFVIFYETPKQPEILEKVIKFFAPDCETSLSLEKIPDPLEAWKDFFTPVECGKLFVVLPPWLARNDFSQKHKIIINPKSAFGTGHHASTCLCLCALDMLAENNLLPQNCKFLDLGCGTGILGIAASMLGFKGTGMDIDPIAIENSLENQKLNKSENIRFVTGSQENMPDEKFGLIFANILAGPLIEMAPILSKFLADNGWMILSGILAIQAEDVLKAYEKMNLKLFRKLEDGEWSALILHLADKPQKN